MTIGYSRALLALAGGWLLSVTPSAGISQSRPFLYSVVPSRGAVTARAVVYGDVAYGNNLFVAVGPEKLEHSLGAQLAVSRRMTLLVRTGWAMSDRAVRNRVNGGAEVLTLLSPPTAHAIVALGLGGAQDYSGSIVMRGRIVAGYVGDRTRVVGNVNLERPVHVVDDDTRDALDLISTVGFAHDITAGLHLGAEAIAEDLEGFFEQDEAEGGAKLMLGPSVGLGSRAARWRLTLVAGPVMQLTGSIVTGGSGAARDLTRTSGYVLRTSISYEW